VNKFVYRHSKNEDDFCLLSNFIEFTVSKTVTLCCKQPDQAFSLRFSNFWLRTGWPLWDVIHRKLMRDHNFPFVIFWQYSFVLYRIRSPDTTQFSNEQDCLSAMIFILQKISLSRSATRFTPKWLKLENWVVSGCLNWALEVIHSFRLHQLWQKYDVNHQGWRIPDVTSEQIPILSSYRELYRI
jgi:hypothetical protein